MKNIKAIVCLSISVLVMACTSCTNGKGEVYTQYFGVTGFDKVDLTIKGEVILIADQEQFIEVKAQQNILNILVFEVSNGNLKIMEKAGKNIGKYEELTIYVHAPVIREVKTSASGNITGSNGIAAPNFMAKSSASGNITITGMNCQSVDATTTASGNIKLSGITEQAKLKTTASGNIQGFDLASNSTQATTSASGNIETTTNNVLEINISASGNVFYKGHPTITINDSGSGNAVDSN